MCTNVGDGRLRKNGSILLAGSCVTTGFPEIIEQQRSTDTECAVLEVCLEETHMNMAGYKLASIVKYSGIRRVTVLTIDGSPHCTQLHHAVEDIKNHFAPEIEAVHYVIEKGRTHRISPEAVKRARHLSKIESSIGKN
jgi:hypothetical protein